MDWGLKGSATRRQAVERRPRARGRSSSARPAARLILGLAALAAAAVAPAGRAQTYPDKATRLLLGNPPGGTTDVAARVLADKMRNVLGQPWVVENRPGAGTLIATQAVAQAQPDGYTLLYATAGVVTGPAVLKNWNVDGVKDLTPISQLVTGTLLVAVNPASPLRGVDDWIAYMKANPGKLNYANISVTDLVPFEMIKAAAGVQWETVRYNGAVPAQNAVIAGQADFTSMPVGALTKSYVDSGKLRLLGAMTEKRSPFMPQVPAFGESSIAAIRELSKFSGLGQYWFGLEGPSALPRALVDTLHGAAVKVSADPDYQKRMGDLGLQTPATSPEAFTATIVAERQRFALEAKKAGVEPQ